MLCSVSSASTAIISSLAISGMATWRSRSIIASYSQHLADSDSAQAIAPGWVPTEYRSGAIEPVAERMNTPALRVGTTLSASSMICSAMPTASRPPLSLPDSASSRRIRPTALR